MRTCSFPRCRNLATMTYHGRGLCDRCFERPTEVLHATYQDAGSESCGCATCNPKPSGWSVPDVQPVAVSASPKPIFTRKPS